MADKHYTLQVETDHIQKLTNARPIPALAELVWNAVDADASRVDIEVDYDEIAMRSITVRDNGHGIPYDEIEEIFGHLGGSWKVHGSRSKTKSRLLHGKEGKGRFKAIGLGRVADWLVTYERNNNFFQYTITIIREDLVDVRVSEEKQVNEDFSTGVEVRISELDRNYRSFEEENAIQPLTEIFALYLTDYSEVSIYFGSRKLDPESVIADRKFFELNKIEENENKFSVGLDFIVWKVPSERSFFLCGTEGFPYSRISPTFHTPGLSFSAYLKTEFVSNLQKMGVLGLAEMNPALLLSYDEAAEKIKTYFREREVEAAKSEIEQWKTDNVYPYKQKALTVVEEAERQVFDIVALNVNKHLPEFADFDKRTKEFQLRMLRQAIERGPDELQLILKEVLDLPQRKQQELAKLLEDADLSKRWSCLVGQVCGDVKLCYVV